MTFAQHATLTDITKDHIPIARGAPVPVDVGGVTRTPTPPENASADALDKPGSKPHTRTMTQTTAPRPLSNPCPKIVVAPDTDYVCTYPHAHAGACHWVDAMGLDYIAQDGTPIYRSGWNYAR